MFRLRVGQGSYSWGTHLRGSNLGGTWKWKELILGDLSSNIVGHNIGGINLGGTNLDFREELFLGELILEDQGSNEEELFLGELILEEQGSNDNRRDLIVGELKVNGGGLRIFPLGGGGGG